MEDRKKKTCDNLSFNTKGSPMTLKHHSDDGSTETPINDDELVNSVADLSKQFDGDVVKMADYIREKYGVR